MEEKETGGQPEQMPVAEVKEEKQQDSVSYDSYRKVLSEKKKRDEQLAALRSRNEELERQTMEAEGRKDDLINSYKSKYEEERVARENDRKSYAAQTVSEKIKREAERRGCVNPDALVKLGDWSHLEVDHSNYTLNSDQLNDAIARAEKEHHYLFQKQAVPTKDLTPASGGMNTGPKKLSEMSTEELIEAARNAD